MVAILPAPPRAHANGRSAGSEKAISRSAISVRKLDFHYGDKQALHGIDMEIERRLITALIGPSGCGKTTLLRCFNRINDRIPNARVSGGSIHVKGKNIYDPDVDPIQLKRHVGMVFQKYNPFPKSIFENVVYGLRIGGERRKSALREGCEMALREAGLWEEVKDRLKDSACGLSGGQMQRLCIARAIAVRPDILLMDEPCSALDPIATLKIEELMTQLKQKYTVVIVTHNMQQARRVSDRTAFLFMGQLMEHDSTETIFSSPKQRKTEEYVSGLFS